METTPQSKQEAVRLANEAKDLFKLYRQGGGVTTRDKLQSVLDELESIVSESARYIEANPAISGEQRAEAQRVLDKLATYDDPWVQTSRSLLRLIAGPEEVDPLLIEARKLVADRYEGSEADEFRAVTLRGEYDNTDAVQNALKALHRGVELAPTVKREGV